MPEQRGTDGRLSWVREHVWRPLSFKPLPAWFWIVAAVAVPADLLSKQHIFGDFFRRYPEVVRARAARRAGVVRLVEGARAAGRPELAELAARGELERLARRATVLGQPELAGLAREVALLETKFPPDKIVEGVFHIVCVENRGGVFGLGQGSAAWVVFGLAATGIVIWFAHRADARPVGLQVALGLVLGGAIANLYDRLTLGAVRDFIEVYYWPGQPWPAFNVADSGICVGAGCLALYAFFFTTKPEDTGKRRGKRG